MKKIYTLFTLTLICLTPLFAGRYAGDFMMIGSGVRALGMGLLSLLQMMVLQFIGTLLV